MRQSHICSGERVHRCRICQACAPHSPARPSRNRRRRVAWCPRRSRLACRRTKQTNKRTRRSVSSRKAVIKGHDTEYSAEYSGRGRIASAKRGRRGPGRAPQQRMRVVSVVHVRHGEHACGALIDLDVPAGERELGDHPRAAPAPHRIAPGRHALLCAASDGIGRDGTASAYRGSSEANGPARAVLTHTRARTHARARVCVCVCVCARARARVCCGRV